MRMLHSYADFGADVSERAVLTLWRACMTYLPAQIDEVDVIGVLFVIRNCRMQQMMSLFGIGCIDNAEACRDAPDMGVHGHKWQAVGKHERTGGGFGADAGDTDEPFECIVG